MVLGGWAIAFAAEWASTAGPGIPFGVYHYRLAGLRHDWLVLGVPVFDSVSFTWLAYCAYTLVGWLGARRGRRLLLGALVMVAIDLLVDPVALRGARWFLGSIYSYPPGSGAWFGVSYLNYGGWLVVGLALQFWLRLCLGETRPQGSAGLLVSGVLVIGVYLQSAVLAVALGVGPTALACLGALLAAGALARWPRPQSPSRAGPPLLVACALSSEARAARAALPGRWERSRSGGLVRWASTGLAVEVWETGMGQTAARAGARRAPSGSPVLVAGVAGGCAPGWELGMVGVASSVLTPAGAWVRTDQVHTDRLLLAGAGRPCRLASVAGIADEPDARDRLVERGSDLVEMETAAWLEERGPGVTALRVVLDTRDQPLGPAGQLLRLGGRGPSPGLLLTLLARHPMAVPSLIAVGRRQRAALAALTKGVAIALEVMRELPAATVPGGAPEPPQGGGST